MSTKDRERLTANHDQEDPSVDDIRDMLLRIQNKVLGSPALNGGFETLIHKMDNFEKRQDQVIESVEEIHEAVYNPDEGLFARIRDTEVSKTNEIHALAAEIKTIKMRQELDDRDHQKESEAEKEMKRTIDEIKENVAEMQRAYAILKWISITMSGGVILATIKAIYDFIINHVKFM